MPRTRVFYRREEAIRILTWLLNNRDMTEEEQNRVRDLLIQAKQLDPAIDTTLIHERTKEQSKAWRAVENPLQELVNELPDDIWRKISGYNRAQRSRKKHNLVKVEISAEARELLRDYQIRNNHRNLDTTVKALFGVYAVDHDGDDEAE